MDTMTAFEKIKEITEALKNCGIDDAEIESEIIICDCLGIDKTILYRDNPVLSDEDVKKMDENTGRRIKREPLQYILGYVEFYGLKIKVGKGVLIPRPETELMAEEVIKKSKVQSPKFKVLDLCTGSGCLALAIAKSFPEAEVYGTDISRQAIQYASENAKINNITNAGFFKGSLFNPVAQFAPFDIVVSNPPYIRSGDIPSLQPEVRDWEPRNALDGGDDGLYYYKEILKAAKRYIKQGTLIFLEAGEGQAGVIEMIACDKGYRDIRIVKDYAGIERIVILAV